MREVAERHILWSNWTYVEQISGIPESTRSLSLKFEVDYSGSNFKSFHNLRYTANHLQTEMILVYGKV